MTISRCIDCQHRDICKYKDEYDNIINNITVKVPDPFTLTLGCKHYYSTYTYLNSTYDNYANTTNCAASVYEDARLANGDQSYLK